MIKVDFSLKDDNMERFEFITEHIHKAKKQAKEKNKTVSVIAEISFDELFLIRRVFGIIPFKQNSLENGNLDCTYEVKAA